MNRSAWIAYDRQPSLAHHCEAMALEPRHERPRARAAPSHRVHAQISAVGEIERHLRFLSAQSFDFVDHALAAQLG